MIGAGTAILLQVSDTSYSLSLNSSTLRVEVSSKINFRSRSIVLFSRYR